jgi:hypothetical protein
MGGASFSGTTEAEVAALLGDCHLVRDPGSLFRHLVVGPAVFADDDLRVRAASCAYYRLYLSVGRRVPGEVWDYLVPVTVAEIEEMRETIAAAPNSYTERWARAEAAVVRLMSARIHLESSTRPPAVLRWSAPGRPLAFGFAPF